MNCDFIKVAIKTFWLLNVAKRVMKFEMFEEVVHNFGKSDDDMV